MRRTRPYLGAKIVELRDRTELAEAIEGADLRPPERTTDRHTCQPVVVAINNGTDRDRKTLI